MNEQPVNHVSAEVHRLVEQAEVVKLTLVEGQTFKNQSIILEGAEWVNCRFVKCQIAVVLGAFRVDPSCVFEDCRIRYNGSAGRVYDLIAATPEVSRHARDKS